MVLVLIHISFPQDFLNMARKKGWFQRNQTVDKAVFVVPAFEGIVVPNTKLDLIHAVEAGKVRSFYSQLCWKCHVCVVLSCVVLLLYIHVLSSYVSVCFFVWSLGSH